MINRVCASFTIFYDIFCICFFTMYFVLHVMQYMQEQDMRQLGVFVQLLVSGSNNRQTKKLIFKYNIQ